MKNRHIAFVIAGFLSVCSVAIGDDDTPSHVATADFGRLGDGDPHNPRVLAHWHSIDALIEKIYKGSRAERLQALEAIGNLRNPWPALPYCAALMSVKDRQVASRSADSLLEGLRQSVMRPVGEVRPVRGQKRQLTEALFVVALNDRLEVDIRGSAIRGIIILDTVVEDLDAYVEKLLADDEPPIRRAALALVSLPVMESLLAPVALISTEEVDKVLRGQAAALLCENALYHGVSAPSEDLNLILKNVLTEDPPVEAVAAILSCLKNFSVSARLDLVDLALKNDDPRVKEFWEQLQG